MNPFINNEDSNQGNGQNFNQPGNNNNSGNNPNNMQNQETPYVPGNNPKGSHVLDQFSLMNNMNQGQNVNDSKVSKDSIAGYNPFKDNNANNDQQNNNNFQQSNIDKMKGQMENSKLGQNPQPQQNISNNNQNSQNNMNNMQQQGFPQNSFQSGNNPMNNYPLNSNNSNDNNPQNNQNPFNNNNPKNNQNSGNNNEVNYPDLDKMDPNNILTNSQKGQNNFNSNNNQNQMSNMGNNQMNNMGNNQMNNMDNNQMNNMGNNQMNNIDNKNQMNNMDNKNQMNNMSNNQMSNMNMNQMNIMSNINDGNQINKNMNNMDNKNQMSNNMNNGDNNNQMSNNNFGMQMSNINNSNNPMNGNNNFGEQMSNMNNNNNNNNPMNSNMNNNNNPMNSNMNNNNFGGPMNNKNNNNFGPQMSNMNNMNNNNQMNVNEQKYSFSRYTKAAKTGLKNLGDTSYLNAVLQLLGSVRNLSSYLVNPKNKIDFEAKANTIPLTYVTHRLFTHFYPYPEKPIPENYEPQVIWSILGQYNQVYKSTKRRNPNDLINFLLINLHRELNTCKTKFMTKMDKTDKELVIKNGLSDFGKSNSSIISNSFHWFEIKSKSCFNCKTNFYDFNNYEIFELDIAGASKKYNAPFTLTDCLSYQTQKFQKLFCEKCGSYQEFQIETKIFSSPIYFIFSLNRGNLEQNLLKINFKLEEKIDIIQHLDKKGAYSKYELSGVVSVYLSENKYVCFGKSPVDKQWYIYNDDNVSNIDINGVINFNSGYGYVPCILLYSHMK